MAILTTQKMAFFLFAFLTISWGSFQTSPTLVLGHSFDLTVELIHRDSPSSPLFKASETTNTLADAVQRSARRVSRTRQNLNSSSMVQALVSPSDGDYLMKMRIGTPPVEGFFVLDTGSDLVWTQCSPCIKCFDQKFPLFNPVISLTYRNVTCDSTECQDLGVSKCESDTCLYSYMFGDGSVTNGVLATDTVILQGSKGSTPYIFPETIIGCGTDNEGNFDGTGIVGFGRGPLSLISRMDSLIDGKFSYCLMPPSSNHSSKLRFAENALISGEKVLSTPLLSGDVDTYYYVGLEGMSIQYGQNLSSGETELAYSSPINMIVDSGTTLTYLPEALYSILEQKLKVVIREEPVDDPTGLFGLCYHSKANFVKPIISMHFTNAWVGLTDSNSFINVSEDVVCLAFAPTEGIPVYGNTQQMNFLVGYDLKQKTYKSVSVSDLYASKLQPTLFGILHFTNDRSVQFSNNLRPFVPADVVYPVTNYSAS